MSANGPICAAIVGLGRWGQNLMAAATNNPDHPLRFVQGVTRTPSKAAQFTKHHGIPVSDDYDAMLENPAIQAVVLATPHSQHCDQICKAANAGKHVFVEKPLALTFDEARRAIDTCNNQGVTLAVGFNRRFLPAFQELYDAQTAGTLGAPLHIDANFSGPFGYQYNADMWRGSVSENPAGGMAAMGIHMLDAMIHLLGPVENVSTLSRQLAIEAPLDDTTNVQLLFQCGATGSLTTLMATNSIWRLQLFGSAGWGAMKDQHNLELALIDKEPRVIDYDANDTLAAELAAFADCAHGHGTFPVTHQEALAGVAAMEAISRSAASNGDRVSVTTVTP
jgi:predicted dehydrogenase